VFVVTKVILTPKGRRPFFGLFLEFGQPIVDAIFVQKISGSTIMPQKQNYFELRAASGNQFYFYFKTFLGWIFFHKFLTKFLKLINL
jgi:hypothetical protein